MAQFLILIFIFLLGASIGSFLSVVLYRVKKGEKGIIFGQSYCPQCKKKLVITDMIPIASYVVLRGRCRHCKKKISPYYFFLELITGLVLLSIYLKYPFLYWLQNGTFMPDLNLLVTAIFFAIYGCFFVAIFFFDLQTNQIPDLFLYPLIGISVLGTIIMGTPDLVSAIIAVLIALVLFGGQIWFSKGKWLGEGDLYLAIALAIIFGWQLFLLTVVASYFIGALISIPLLLSKKAKMKSQIPFGPFLVLGAFMTMFFGEQILNWYLNSLVIV